MIEDVIINHRQNAINNRCEHKEEVRMKYSKDVKQLLETIAKRAWPAKTVKPYENWYVRKNKGVTKRANSVFTLGAMPEDADWLQTIESFYEKEGITPCFYITELSPSSVDQQLADHHYEIDTELSILSIESKQIIEQIEADEQFHTDIKADVSTTWMDAFLSLEGHDEEDRAAFELIFRHIPLQKGFLSLYLEDEIVAVATIATEYGWGYVSNVVVSEHHRRRGIASQVLYQLARWALAHDTPYLFMQVLDDNKPALRLYDKLGFNKVTTSYYRVKQVTNNISKVRYV